MTSGKVQGHQQVYIHWNVNANHSKALGTNFLRSCCGSHTLSCCLPSPVPGRSPNTHHLGSTTEGTASELRAPWGRRFLGPRKRSTSSHGSSWMTKGLSSLLFLRHRLGVSSLFSGHYHSKEQTPSQTSRRDSMVASNIEKGPMQRLTSTGEGTLLSCP